MKSNILNNNKVNNIDEYSNIYYQNNNTQLTDTINNTNSISLSNNNILQNNNNNIHSNKNNKSKTLKEIITPNVNKKSTFRSNIKNLIIENNNVPNQSHNLIIGPIE